MTADVSARLTLMLACALGLGACGGHGDGGPVRAETRTVGAFDAVDLEGAARIEIQVGQPASLVVEGTDRAVGSVSTDVRGGTLHIKSKPGRWFVSDGRARITLKIRTPRLRSLKLEGGNDVHLSGFDGGESSIEVTGAAHITANGHLDELTVHLAGAGRADLSRLIANNANVTVDGVGSVTVSPRDTLDATVNGVGAIFYTGSPRNVSTHMNGLGTISRRDRKDADADKAGGAADAERRPEREERSDDASDKSTIVI